MHTDTTHVIIANLSHANLMRHKLGAVLVQVLSITRCSTEGWLNNFTSSSHGHAIIPAVLQPRLCQPSDDVPPPGTEVAGCPR